MSKWNRDACKWAKGGSIKAQTVGSGVHTVADFPIGELIIGLRKLDPTLSGVHTVMKGVRTVKTTLLLPVRAICAGLGSAGRELGRGLEEATTALAAPRILVHAAIWFQIQGDDGVITEYGAYQGEGCGYFDTDGARFVIATRSEFEAQFPERIPCRASRPVTFTGLGQWFRGNGWRSGDYSLTKHNCQKFAAEIICLTGARMVHAHDKAYITTRAPPDIYHPLLQQTGDM
jgi:hypothetical protein